MAVCFLGIGSNLGNRQRNIRLALGEIRALKNTKILKMSKIRETQPQGGPVGQGQFLNAALKIETQLSPVALLKNLKAIEKGLGRARTVRWGPRTIDLDILLYAGNTVKRKELKIPHPRMWQREFVLRPLLEIL